MHLFLNTNPTNDTNEILRVLCASVVNNGCMSMMGG